MYKADYMNRQHLEKKLEDLRRAWKLKPHLRSIIERQAKALKIALSYKPMV